MTKLEKLSWFLIDYQFGVSEVRDKAPSDRVGLFTSQLRENFKKNNCDICGKEDSNRLSLAISPILRFNICKDCMNLYASHQYDELREKLNKNKNVLL